MIQNTQKNDFITTGALVTPPRAEKGRRGFIARKESDIRNNPITLRVPDAYIQFINAYCEKYSITKTELLLRSINCFTGYNGKNGSQILSGKYTDPVNLK